MNLRFNPVDTWVGVEPKSCAIDRVCEAISLKPPRYVIAFLGRPYPP